MDVKVFGGQNAVICCVESERDPVHIASLEEMEFVRQDSLPSEKNQQAKQEFGRIAMKRSRHVHVIQTCFGRPLIGFRCFADKPWNGGRIFGSLEKNVSLTNSQAGKLDFEKGK